MTPKEKANKHFLNMFCSDDLFKYKTSEIVSKAIDVALEEQAKEYIIFLKQLNGLIFHIIKCEKKDKIDLSELIKTELKKYGVK